MHKLILFLLLIVWSTNYPSDFYYIIFFILTFCCLTTLFVRCFRFLFGRVEDYIALSFLIVWLYGLCIGLYQGNKTSFVVSNFAGMVCYFTYFIFVVMKINIYSLLRVILLSGVIVSFLSIIVLVLYHLGFYNEYTILFLGDGIDYTSTLEQIRCRFATLSLAYSLMAASLLVLISNNLEEKDIIGIKKKKRALFYFLLSVVSLFFISASKGFVLGAIFVLSLISFLIYFKQIICAKVSVSLFFLMFVSFILFYLLIKFDYYSIIEKMFSEEDNNNIVRYEQLYSIVNDITFWGKGLGATISGVVRDAEKPYGFELVYINLVHKFGIFSLFLFFGWIHMFKSLFIFLYQGKYPLYTSVAIGSLGYLFPAIGNPLLMAPGLVILNCFTLYYIRVIRSI